MTTHMPLFERYRISSWVRSHKDLLQDLHRRAGCEDATFDAAIEAFTDDIRLNGNAPATLLHRLLAAERSIVDRDAAACALERAYAKLLEERPELAWITRLPGGTAIAHAALGRAAIGATPLLTPMLREGCELVVPTAGAIERSGSPHLPPLSREAFIAGMPIRFDPGSLLLSSGFRLYRLDDFTVVVTTAQRRARLAPTVDHFQKMVATLDNASDYFSAWRSYAEALYAAIDAARRTLERIHADAVARIGASAAEETLSPAHLEEALRAIEPLTTLDGVKETFLDNAAFAKARERSFIATLKANLANALNASLQLIQLASDPKDAPEYGDLERAAVCLGDVFRPLAFLSRSFALEGHAGAVPWLRLALPKASPEESVPEHGVALRRMIEEILIAAGASHGGEPPLLAASWRASTFVLRDEGPELRAFASIRSGHESRETLLEMAKGLGPAGGVRFVERTDAAGGTGIEAIEIDLGSDGGAPAGPGAGTLPGTAAAGVGATVSPIGIRGR